MLSYRVLAEFRNQGWYEPWKSHLAPLNLSVLFCQTLVPSAHPPSTQRSSEGLGETICGLSALRPLLGECSPLSQAEGSPPLWSPRPLAFHPQKGGPVTDLTKSLTEGAGF